MAISEIFPPEATESELFKKNVEDFFALSESALAALKANLPTLPSQLRDEEFTRRAAGEIGMEVADYKSVAVVARMATAAASSESSSPTLVLDYLAKLVGVDLDVARRSALENFMLDVLRDEKETSEVRAFSFGETFAGITFRPLLVPVRGEGSISYLFGGSLQVDYVDNSSDRRSLSLNISLPELAALVRELADELKSLESLKNDVTKGGV